MVIESTTLHKIVLIIIFACELEILQNHLSNGKYILARSLNTSSSDVFRGIKLRVINPTISKISNIKAWKPANSLEINWFSFTGNKS